MPKYYIYIETAPANQKGSAWGMVLANKRQHEIGYYLGIEKSDNWRRAVLAAVKEAIIVCKGFCPETTVLINIPSIELVELSLHIATARLPSWMTEQDRKSLAYFSENQNRIKFEYDGYDPRDLRRMARVLAEGARNYVNAESTFNQGLRFQRKEILYATRN